jgi:ubiquitin carboxyl-terminal hydrolase 14
MPKSLGTDAKANMMSALATLFADLNKSGDSIPPIVFLQVFRMVYPQFAEQDRSGYLQQDAEEAWGQIIHALGEKVPGLTLQGDLHPTKKFVDQFMTVETMATYFRFEFYQSLVFNAMKILKKWLQRRLKHSLNFA